MGRSRVIDGSSPGQSEIITALSDIKKQAAHRATCVAPQVRLELTTLRLTAECSAIELLRNIFSFSLPLCCSLMFESGKNFRSSRSPLDPGNFLLSQAVPSSVPSAFGGLTSVFGMGTGGALQLSSPETFPGALSRFLSASLRSSLPRRALSAFLAPPPRTFKTAQVRVDQQTYTLLRLPWIKPSTD